MDDKMFLIALLGSMKDRIAGESLYRFLSKSAAVLYLSSDKILQSAENPQILLFETDKLAESQAKVDVFILKEQLGESLSIAIPENSMVIFSSDSEDSAEHLKNKGLHTFSCGMRSTDTVSCSSINGDLAMISLLRQLTDISGKTIEPFEHAAVLHEKSSVYPSLAAFLCLILLGNTP